MLILSSKLSPKPLNSSDANPRKFKCDLCGRDGEGALFKGVKKASDWAVLPEEWEETLDRRPNPKRKFAISCSAECSKTAAGTTK